MRVLTRVLDAVLSVGVGALVVSLVEARFVQVGTSGEVTFAGALLATLGLVFPLAMAVGLAASVASLFLEPGKPKTLGDHWARFRVGSIEERAVRTGVLTLGAWGTFLWLVATSHVTKSLLARASLERVPPLASGVAMATAALVLSLCVGMSVFAALPPMQRVGIFALNRAPWLLWAAPLASISAVIVVLLIGVKTGDPSGAGGSVLSIFGVLGRAELDLRPVGHLALLGACTLFGLTTLSGAPRFGKGIASLVLLGAGMSLTVLLATLLDEHRAIAQGVEAHAPLGKVGLRVVRRATDRDRDGASRHYGGGDCNDRDPTIGPMATDIPGNGIDEDCSGEDMPLPPPEPEHKAPVLKEVLRAHNILFITVDTLRPNLGFMGYPLPTSPELDKLAARSTVFERAYAMASYTGKSIGPLLIGKYPSETKRDGDHFNTYAPDNITVAERLRDKGFRTFGFASHWYFKPRFGMSQGFDTWDMSAMPADSSGDTDNSTTSHLLTDAAIRVLSKPENASSRFLAWVHYFDPHLQYVPHQGAPDFLVKGIPYAHLKAAYDGEVWYVDKQIGRLLDFVWSQPWGENTAIVVTADHGESFGEHAVMGHGVDLWEPLVRVPLVIYVPKGRPHRIREARGHIDLVPTLLELAGVAPPGPGELSGQSLLSDIRRQEGDPPAPRDVYLDMPEGPHTPMRRALVYGEQSSMKLLHLGGTQYRLFDLGTDPDEQKDLSSNKELLSEGISRMQRVRARLKEIWVRPVTVEP